MIQPCKTVVLCEQTPNPVLGFNSETPDVLNKIAVANAPSTPPPLNSKWEQPTAQVEKDVPITTPADQRTADLLAVVDATERAAAGWTTQDGWPVQTFQNGEQSTVLSCPGGSLFTFGIIAGLFSALTQAEADQKAASYFIRQQQLFDGCLNGMGADTLCLNSPGVMTLAVTGASFGNNEYTLWTLTGGSLPPGMTFGGGSLQSMTCQIIGTPTATGSYTFSVRATTPSGTFLESPFTINVVGVISTALPAATALTAYSAQIAWVGFAFPQFSINPASALPAGLSMSSTGLISGTPTVSGNFSILVDVDEMDFSCQQTVTISISSFPVYQVIPSLAGGVSNFDGGANFGAGVYQIEYLVGAVQFADSIQYPIGFVLNNITYGEFASSLTFNAVYPGNSIPMPLTNGKFDTQQEAETANNGVSYMFTHPGGQIGMVTVMSIPGEYVAGSPNPTFQLTRLS